MILISRPLTLDPLIADSQKMTQLYSDAKLILLRHGESEGNASKVVQGDGEYPLSERGKKQALEAKAVVSLWQPNVYMSSDLSRAFDTALIISDFAPIIQDIRYRERSAGKWEGISRDELERAYPGSIENDALRPEGYESEKSVYARILPALEDSLEYDGLVVVVSHGAVFRLIERYFGGTGERFKHLEGLAFNKDFALLGRVHTIGDK